MRTAIGKRLRFEIFKRDKFTCVYCGRKPPEVMLEADHVHPVAEGGQSEEVNLVTSCKECNSGKGKIPLNVLPDSCLETIEERRERIEQLEAMRELIAQERDLFDRMLDMVSDVFIKAWGSNPDEKVIAGRWERSVRMFLKRMPVDHVIEAAEITMNKFNGSSSNSAHRYFCGCCWRMVKGEPFMSNPQSSDEQGKF